MTQEKSKAQLELEYPHLKADIDLCYKYLFQFCAGRTMPAMSVPPHKTDFDMQMSAAFEELKAYRDMGVTLEHVAKFAGK